MIITDLGAIRIAIGELVQYMNESDHLPIRVTVELVGNGEVVSGEFLGGNLTFIRIDCNGNVRTITIRTIGSLQHDSVPTTRLHEMAVV
jgi:hypothetical protein